MFLAPSSAIFVLWIHILAATVWIGGQIMLGVLVPMLSDNRPLMRAAAQRAQWPLWIAFVLLAITGIINISNAGIDGAHLTGSPAGRTLILKLVFVLISGAAAAIHAWIVGPMASQRPSRDTRAASGILGVCALLAALLAALYGVIIAEH